MNSKERLHAALSHREPDRVPVDFGATTVTGIHASTLAQLRRTILGDPGYRVTINEPYQMLGELDDLLLDRLGIDTVGLFSRRTMFGFESCGWKPWRMFDGTEVLVPEKFRVQEDTRGDLLIFPEGDTTAPPSARMPKGGHFFDAIVRQPPLVEEQLNSADNTEEFSLLADDDLAWYARRIEELQRRGDRAIVMVIPGAAFGDIALVPATWMKNPKGIRAIDEWYVSTAVRRSYIMQVFEKQCEIALANLDRIIDVVGDRASVAFISGADFGTQHGLFISKKAYRELFKPFHVQVNRRVHERTAWKTFIHSCGAVADLIPEFIEAGFDILNPVQCSATGMDPQMLKREFGRSITFWGGGGEHPTYARLRCAGGGLPRGARADRHFRPRRRIRVQYGPQRPSQYPGAQPSGHVPGDCGRQRHTADPMTHQSQTIVPSHL